jgi:hypothetical protein
MRKNTIPLLIPQKALSMNKIVGWREFIRLCMQEEQNNAPLTTGNFIGKCQKSFLGWNYRIEPLTML